ncbi:MAG TPA: sugar-binding protein, partial [Thermoleophilia bacterium]|nr:sugar-binding protein [Thermoleophilia bacterium]
MDTQDLTRHYAMNVILKIESFPEECFDEARYGDREAFRKTSRHGAWAKNTLPRKGPYQAWLRQEVRRVPEGQNVFEIWNEAWQWQETLTAEDFARLSNWAVEAIKAGRPDGIVGPNIQGDLTPYDLAVMRAGGLKGMDMVAIHPYTAGTPESKGFRQRLRNYHDLLRRETGRDLDLYSTEYGWATAPQGDRCVSEAEQARRTVRESLMLYAEGIKTLIPHTMGQREQDPKDREHYFGFFRLTLEPKPVAMAHIACARAIDGSRFVGDLWFGPGVGAMVFQRDGTRTLALWTEGDARQLDIDTKSPAVTRVDTMGRERKLSTAAGRITVDVSGDVVYLVGVGKELADGATPPTEPLRVDRWKKRHDATYAAARAAAPPAIDGQLADWSAVTPITMANPKLSDIGARARLLWDNAALYVAVEVDDKRILNDNDPTGIRSADCVDVHICTRPDRQADSAGLYDYNVVVAPTSKGGGPAFILKNPAMREPIINPGQGDASGIVWASKRGEKGWSVEFAVPWKVLPGAENGPLPKLSFAIAVFDRDTTEHDEWKQWHKRVYNYDPKRSPAERPLLALEGRREASEQTLGQSQ